MSTASSASKPSSGWQPPSLEEMQAMLPQYRFEKLLGRGGMGAVYKAVQASLERPVAIKVLPVDLVEDDDAQFAERFKNEARTMAKLSHPGIVDVFDFGETKTGLLYIVMEFIEGTDIAQMIQSQGKLPEDYALSITAHVCDALAYAHQNGIVHRDIKPANILINTEGAIKVADFGLAKANDPNQSGITKTNMAMGTPDFVAPEAFIPGIPLDGRADLYAIGVMLYQMLTGEIPRGIWTLPGMKVGTDPRFDAIITKAMQTDREVRYQTATDIRRDLDTILTLPRSALIAQQQAAAEAAAQASREARHQEAAAAQAPRKGPPVQVRAPQPVAKKSSSGGLIFGIAAIVIAAAGAFFIFGGSDKPKPDDTAATSGAPSPAGDTTKQATPRNPAAATKDTPFENSLGMKFVQVPGTKALFSIWETRVKDYEKFAAANPSVSGSWKNQKAFGQSIGQEPDHPALGMRWDDAQAFCAWLTKKESSDGALPQGAKYRLPTDAEWSLAAGLPPESGNTPQEKGAGANQNRSYPWGNQWPPPPKAGNLQDETYHDKFQQDDWVKGYTDGYAGTAPVGSFTPNSFGIYDLSGNVWEWCEDWHDATRKTRVIRGGGWGNNGGSGQLQSAVRHQAAATFNSLGFRVVIELPDSSFAAPRVLGESAPTTPPAATIASLPVTGWRPLQPETVQADGWGKLTKSSFVPGYPPDIAIRARLRFVPSSAGISAQSTNAVGSYRAEITPKGDAVMLHRDSPVAAERKLLARAALSTPLTPGQEYVLAVASVGDTVSVHVDGRPLLSERLPKLPGSVVLWTRGPVDVRDIEWLALTGSTPSSPAATPAMISPVAGANAVPLDTAQRFSGLSLPRDLTKKGSRSSWEFSGEHLVLSDTVFTDLQLLALPSKPGDSYELEMEYAFRADNSGYLKLFLPAPGGWCSVQLHVGQIVCFFDNNRQPHNHAVKPGGETTRLRVKSERAGAAARFTVTLDGKPLTEFTGTGVTEWQYWPDMSPLRGSICLGGETKGGPPITLHSFRLVSTGATPSTMAVAATPPVTAPASRPAPATAEGWIDLLAKADVQRDSLQLPWSLTDGVLQSPAEPNSAITPDGHNTFAFPVPNPPLNYDLRYRLSRNKPGAAIVMPFLRGNETPVLYVDGGYGFQLFGAKTSGPDNSNPAWFPPDKVIHEVLIEVRESHLSARFDGRLLLESDGPLPKGQVGQPFFQSTKAKVPVIGIGVCGGIITVHEAAYRPVDVLAEKSAVMSAADPYLAKLESGFQARYQADAQKPFETALASLNQSYIANGISKARAAAQAKGALPEVLAFDREKALVEKDSDVPAEDAADTSDALKKLRATYRAAHAKLVTERDAKAAPLMNIYLKALNDYAAELTKSGKLDEAKQVQALRDMKASKVAAATPAPAQAAVPSTPVPSADAPVAAATFLVNNGGSCIAVKDGVRVNVKTAADIPALPFDVVEMNFDTYQGASKTAKSSDFQVLNGLRSLRRVMVRAPECKLLKDDGFAFLAGNEDLDFINLEGVPVVTDGVLKHLSSAKKLTTLGVQYAPGFTGEGLASMPFLSGLINADFLGSGLNDRGVEALTACAQLQKLRITQGSASDAAFAKLGSVSKLVDLRVDHTGFGDKAAAAIASAGVLQYLDASFTEIGDSGLEKLEALGILNTLVITNTKVSNAAVARLQKALPNCKVTH